jgi:hypothetical protein
MNPLQVLSPSIWNVDHAFRMAGMDFGTRTTVIRLSNGSLVLHAPGEILPEKAAAIDALGPVAAIIAPNLFHHLFLGAAHQRWPQAKVYAPPGLKEKVPDLHIDQVLQPEGELGPGLHYLLVRGVPKMGEVILHHPGDKALVVGDISFNFVDHPQWWLRTFMTLNGCYGKLGFSRLGRSMVSDQAALRESIETVRRWDWDALSVCHGRTILSGAKAQFGAIQF